MEPFERQLAGLKEMLLTMASHAESSVHKAIEALGRRDYDLARKVEADDTAIDRFEVEVDDLAVRLLGQAPRANDLRLITVAMKVAQNLERVGDETTTIARRVRQTARLARQAASAPGRSRPSNWRAWRDIPAASLGAIAR